jgi:flagellin-like protein
MRCTSGLKRGKRGISPVVATVLLVLLVVILALIIFLWFRAITREAITKSGVNVEVICNDPAQVVFDASFAAGKLAIRNNGEIAIYDFLLKKKADGTTVSNRLRDEDSSFDGLSSGQAGEFSIDAADSNEIVIIPVLLGQTQSGVNKEHECDERIGISLTI